jgi:hypothetical protein
VDDVLAMARASGYELLSLETFSELRAAARIYRDHGFQVVREETNPRWGRPEITYQHYRLPLGAHVDAPAGRPDRLGNAVRA